MDRGQAYSAILTSLAVILTSLAQYVRSRKDRREKHDETVAKVEQVQEVVNGTHQAALERIDQLTDALAAAGIVLPPHPEPETP